MITCRTEVRCDHEGCPSSFTYQGSPGFGFSPFVEEAVLARGWEVDELQRSALCPDHRTTPARPLSRLEWMKITGAVEPYCGWSAAGNIHDRNDPLCECRPGCGLPPGHSAIGIWFRG